MNKDLVEEMYLNKNTEYFSLEREIFKNSVLGKNLNILDIGCGTGILGKYFKENQNCKVYGVEINESAYQAAIINLDNVLKGNVESIDLKYPDNFFDVVIMGDVVEHLISPVDTINKIMPFLKIGGTSYITVPNVRHWSVIKNLLFFDLWEYDTWGILDFTHLRFFTKKSITNLFQRNNIYVKSAGRMIQKKSKSSYFNFLTLGIFSGFLASHTFLTLEKKG
jgi:2-polyprenyl-3-methyl-5-hydroxy-6-metoxy-1,4-benzoquinol methylase